MIKDSFKGVTGIPASVYSDMSWDDALTEIFNKLPRRGTLKLETAKDIVVLQCRKGDKGEIGTNAIDVIDEMKQFLYKHKDVGYTDMLAFLDELENKTDKEIESEEERDM